MCNFALLIFTQAGLVSVSALLHFMVRPVQSKYFDLSDLVDAKEVKSVGDNNKILEK